MKAVVIERFGGPEVMEYREVPSVEPVAGQVLIEVHAVTVNRAFDIQVREGTDGRTPRFPIVPGVDAAGKIVEVGPGVSPDRVGERVAVRSSTACRRCDRCRAGEPCSKPAYLGIDAWGGYADFVVVGESSVRAVPANLSYPEASVIFRHFPTAFHLFDCKAQTRAGELALIMGASGGLGTALVQVARMRGARVIAAAGSDAGCALARELGAHESVNYRAERLDEAVFMRTGGRGVDVVFENIGAPDLFGPALASLAPGGRLVTAGAHGGGEVALDLKRLYRRKLQIIGAAGSDQRDFDDTFSAASRGALRASIDRILPLSAVREAHRLVSDRIVAGKVVLVPDQWYTSTSANSLTSFPVEV